MSKGPRKIGSDLSGLAPGYKTMQWPLSSDDTFPMGCTAYVGTGGVVMVRGYLDEPGHVTPFKVPDGGQIPVRLADIISAGTTADDIVLIYGVNDAPGS